MNRKQTILAAALLMAGLLNGCEDMHEQPSFKAYEAPRLAPPAAAVPVQGEEVVSWGSILENPVAATPESIRRGEALFAVNCALCHGTRQSYPGKVGVRYQPPPPNLYDMRTRNLGASDLYKRITLGFGRMPAFANWLPNEERWHLVNYLKTFL